MAVDSGQVAVATVAAIAPFTPFLIEMGSAGVKKLSEVIAQKGGEAAWEKAKQLWEKLKTRFGKDKEVQSAATMVAAKPGNETRQKMLAEVLAERLEQQPKLVEELAGLLGGVKGVQKVLADKSSWVEDITQRMKGSGEQIVQASDDSVIRCVKQSKE
jgi:hypothetical protein